jgi:protein gp37
MAAAARWSDLTGTDRPDKPWLNGHPRMVFISDMGDALSRGVPFEFLRDEVIATVATWRHIGMWLTKQPQRMHALAEWLATQGIPWPENLWAGTSITSAQQLARLGWIQRVPAAVRFLSVEPMLGPVRFTSGLSGIHLVIVGGGSGPHADPCDVAWVRSIVQQGQAAGVATFVKQLGSHVLGAADVIADGWPRGTRVALHERRVHLRDRKGGNIDEFSDDLKVRQWPEVRR